MHIPRDLRVAKTLPDLIYRADVDSINYIINAPDSCRVIEKFTTDLDANSDLAFRHRFSFFIFTYYYYYCERREPTTPDGHY